jgi:hypothetical protein
MELAEMLVDATGLDDGAGAGSGRGHWPRRRRGAGHGQPIPLFAAHAAAVIRRPHEQAAVFGVAS